MTANPLVGELNPASGHGTFIAGIVRQVAPDARILAVRVMLSDDIAYTGDIICALRHLAKRIALGAPGDVAAMVDVVSLSFGYFSESPPSVASHSGLWRVIKLLLRLGVVVVAAAGNYATWRRFYPAAFATEAVPSDEVPVISVGALNPNGTKAVFSDDGHWVTAFAQGALVLSTYPTDINASRSPELRMSADPPPPDVPQPARAALKPDDFTDGFALWSGTSFSAPHMAARIIVSLQEGATNAGLRLNLPDRNARAVAAWENLRQQGYQNG
jgi:subtilisin family serine protease